MAWGQWRGAVRGGVRTEGSLEPFRGSFGSGICFEGGHCFWLFRFGETPTPFGAYDGIWSITPAGERVLYADPVEVVRVASTYHEFDRVVGASIRWSRMDRDVVELHVDGQDGVAIDLCVRLGASVGSRLLNGLIALAPRSFLRTPVGAALSNLGLARVVDANGLKAVGRTDRAEPYRFEADWFRGVETAWATVDGEDLGEPSTPERPVAFGDVRTPNEPFVAAGDLFLRPPAGAAAPPTTRTPESAEVARSPSPRSR